MWRWKRLDTWVGQSLLIVSKREVAIWKERLLVLGGPNCNPFGGLYFSTNWRRKSAGFPRFHKGLGLAAGVQDGDEVWKDSALQIWRATRLTSFSVSSSEGARTGSFPTCFVILFRLLSGSFTGFVQGNVFGGNHRLNTRIRGVPIIISEVLQATLYGTAFQHEINHVALFVGHWPILARVSFAPKDPFFFGFGEFQDVSWASFATYFGSKCMQMCNMKMVPLHQPMLKYGRVRSHASG